MSSRLIFALALTLAFAANVRAQTPEPAMQAASPPTSQIAAMPVVEVARPALAIAPATAVARPPDETRQAAPADGYMESERAAHDDMETWFRRYGETLRRAE